MSEKKDLGGAKGGYYDRWNPLTKKSIETLGALWLGSWKLYNELEEAKKRPVPQEILDVYEKDQEIIEKIYGKEAPNPNLLFHGTGALQYDGNKYTEGVRSHYREPLDTILEEGLKPHLDPWIMGVESVQSISFATAWSYAKWYADKHQHPTDPLKWEYGDSNLWFSFFMTRTILEEIKEKIKTTSVGAKNIYSIPGKLLSYVKNIRQNPQAEQDIVGLNRLQKWITDLRADITTATPPLDIIRMRTDIPGNYGAIVTLPNKDVSLFDMGYGRVYEERSAEQVQATDFTSISVPFNKVEQQKTKLDSLGLRLPVLATEAIEYHMSKFKFPQVTYELSVKR